MSSHHWSTIPKAGTHTNTTVFSALLGYLNLPPTHASIRSSKVAVAFQSTHGKILVCIMAMSVELTEEDM